MASVSFVMFAGFRIADGLLPPTALGLPTGVRVGSEASLATGIADRVVTVLLLLLLLLEDLLCSASYIPCAKDTASIPPPPTPLTISGIVPEKNAATSAIGTAATRAIQGCFSESSKEGLNPDDVISM